MPKEVKRLSSLLLANHHPTAASPPPIILSAPCHRNTMTIDAISYPQNRDAKLLHQ